jgi:cytochrome c553
MSSIGRWRWSTFLMGFFALLLMLTIAVLAEQKSSQTPPPSGAAAPTAQQPTPSGYVGDDTTCLTCHDTQGYRGTAHARAFNERSPRRNRGAKAAMAREKTTWTLAATRPRSSI